MVKPAKRGRRLTSAEINASAIALRPQLLLRARELCGQRADLDAEDLLGDTYLKFVAKPPSPKTALQLKHWLRTVMLRIWLNVREREGELEVVSYEAELSKQRAN